MADRLQWPLSRVIYLFLQAFVARAFKHLRKDTVKPDGLERVHKALDATRVTFAGFVYGKTGNLEAYLVEKTKQNIQAMSNLQESQMQCRSSRHE